MHIASAKFVKGIAGTDAIINDGTPQVAFVGRSNVGKSSLINSLTNEKKLVKVSDKPGKTKEINFFLINKKFYLVDLPGYGFARGDMAERDRLKKLIFWYMTDPDVNPELVVLVVDTKVGVTPFDEQMIEILRDNKHPFVVAANKTDKLNQKELSSQLSSIADKAKSEVIPCSAVSKNGAAKLLQVIFPRIS